MVDPVTPSADSTADKPPHRNWRAVLLVIGGILLVFGAAAGWAVWRGYWQAVPTVGKQHDLSRLLKIGLTKKEVYEILEVKSVSLGPVLTVYKVNERYRTRKFPYQVVDVTYDRSPNLGVTLISWELTTAESYDSFIDIEYPEE